MGKSMKNFIQIFIGLAMYVCLYVIVAQASAGNSWAFVILLLLGLCGWLLSKKKKTK